MTDPEPTKLDLARDLLRKNPAISPEELKEALGLANNQVAKGILQSARQKEDELRTKLAAEDKAADLNVASSVAPPRLYLQDPHTKQVFELVMVKEGAKRVVFTFIDDALTVGVAQ
jgi:hypothetical protein